jgi:hypothetical protein
MKSADVVAAMFPDDRHRDIDSFQRFELHRKISL